MTSLEPKIEKSPTHANLKILTQAPNLTSHFETVQYKLHPKSPPPATPIIEPSISFTFFAFFCKKCEKLSFTLLYQILSNLLKKSILHYNIGFSWIF